MPCISSDMDLVGDDSFGSPLFAEVPVYGFTV